MNTETSPSIKSQNHTSITILIFCPLWMLEELTCLISNSEKGSKTEIQKSC